MGRSRNATTSRPRRMGRTWSVGWRRRLRRCELRLAFFHVPRGLTAMILALPTSGLRGSLQIHPSRGERCRYGNWWFLRQRRKSQSFSTHYGEGWSAGEVCICVVFLVNNQIAPFHQYRDHRR
ncbi:hypothetical protein BDV98DRAFT_573313 [Pterulicium gracile]|uniref:Uncharacterized protein n=1 Tax=Pterulicium gracile TaxID=1884261 RepID=A0A5C3QB08_9AGAR|nr:hypothetical protein BDV98DRAFT_573313 [Pterula gracilis]